MAGLPAIKTITVDDKIMSNSETMNANELVTTQEITNNYRESRLYFMCAVLTLHITWCIIYITNNNYMQIKERGV